MFSIRIDLSCAIFSMELHVHSFCFSCAMVRHQVSFGLPRDLFPSGVHLRAILGGEGEGTCRICPISSPSSLLYFYWYRYQTGGSRQVQLKLHINYKPNLWTLNCIRFLVSLSGPSSIGTIWENHFVVWKWC